MKHSVPVPFVPGDDEMYMSDGLPLDEKEEFAFEEHRRCTLVGMKVHNGLELATESVPKLKNKKKEVIVDVQEVEIDEFNPFVLEKINPMDNAYPFHNDEIAAMNNNEQEGESQNKIQQKLDLKIDVDKIDNEFDNVADDDTVHSPAIYFIDSENVKHHVLDKDAVLIDQDHEKLQDDAKMSIKEHENPDHCKNQEELEKLKHAEDHPDDRRLSVDLIVEHPEVFKHNANSELNHELENHGEQNNEQKDVVHTNQEHIVHEVEENEEPQILSKDTMMLIGKSPEEPNAEEDDEVNENDENSDHALEQQDSLVWGDGEEEYANFENTADEENKDNKKLELLEKAEALKQEGNEFFKAKEYGKARSKYSRVFAYTKGIAAGQTDGGDQMTNMAINLASRGNISEELKIRATNLERDVNSNMAMVYLIEENWPKVIDKATASINIDPSPKAFFRRGKAHAMKNDFENAYKDLELGKSLR